MTTTPPDNQGSEPKLPEPTQGLGAHRWAFSSEQMVAYRAAGYAAGYAAGAAEMREALTKIAGAGLARHMRAIAMTALAAQPSSHPKPESDGMRNALRSLQALIGELRDIAPGVRREAVKLIDDTIAAITVDRP